MKKTYVTHMDDHVGAFLLACRKISALGVNITRVSYNKSIDIHMLFIEVEGEPGQIEETTRQLESIGYLQDSYSDKRIALMEFQLIDRPGAVQPVLELIHEYNFNISYINSQANDSGTQAFKMGLLVEDGEQLDGFVRKAAALCPVRVLSYDRTERNLDNTVFYLSFANDIAARLKLPEKCKNDLIINANEVMQMLDEKNSSPYKTFEYIGRFAECMAKYKGEHFQTRMSMHKTAQGALVYLFEPPCGSNLCVIRCGERYLFVDSGFPCYHDEQMALLRDVLPGFDARPRDALLTHADVDHCGMMSEFGTVYLSRKCYENFRREHLGKDNFREENPIHRPYVRISKILTGYEPPSLSNLRVIGGKQEKQEQPIEYIGCVDCEELHFEAYEGMGGHVAGETVFIERAHRLVFTGDIFVNLKDFTPEQASFNRLAPYLMTSVDSDPSMAAKERKAVMELLGKGEWLLIGGHGAALHQI